MTTVDTDANLVNESDQVGAQATRVWEHLLHEDGDFVQRSNFFLIGESMLVVAYAGILAGGQTVGDNGAFDQWRITIAVKAIGVFGLLLTAVWAYVCHDHFRYLLKLRLRAQQFLPEYRALRASKPHRFRSATALMAYGVPGLTATLWLFLLVLI